MGWLKLGRTVPSTQDIHDQTAARHHLKDNCAIHIEILGTDKATFEIDYESYRPQPYHLSTSQLPLISGDIVRAVKGSDRLWIVVDNVVFDCTEFASEHPGGRTVIESFTGEDCSWQFWRFHNKSHMRKDGLPLRIGRTEGVVNRFKERPRFHGLRRHGDDEA
ncbi:hypothetical protein LTR56_025569 [Elasticomyces elasticus]|nr:hypothetical protein LTR56_025569 [Elasticomyces elasticus]KAK3649897.1 hypothetical protein LTR22_012773 [Elasticomyces elasticus]KAK4918152.1 hypothetical protein LTR49_014008 [Elasticomyces elasticus]KAK5757698.1 hypothetical protein LTS12_012157 [Elasticomyces elasticus]